MELRRFRHFDIERLLGRGGMGEVYLAYDANLERRVALKLLPRELLRDPAAQGRLLDEARSISRVQHPNIAVIHSIEEDGGVYALCMEYIEGQSLKQLLQENGPLPLPQILRLAAQIAAGMQAAHEVGIVHRDLKPANVMVTRDGQAKVMDFGLALRPQRVVDTVGSSTYGTVQYMSPEQARGEALDARSDIFSFGSTLYEITTGRAPFQGPNDLAILQAILNVEPPRLRDVRREVPPAFEQFLRGCMAKPVGARWDSMRAVLEELRYLTPVADAGPRDLISELSNQLSEGEDEQHKPRNHGAVGRRPGRHNPPAGAQSGPVSPVPPVEMDFGGTLPEGVVIHEIVDRGIVEYGPSSGVVSPAPDSPAPPESGASAGLDIQTTSEQWQEMTSQSCRIDSLRREAEADRQRSRAPVEAPGADFEELFASEDAEEPTTAATVPEGRVETASLPRTTSTPTPRPGAADPFLGVDPQRHPTPSRTTPRTKGESRWKLVVPMVLALILAAAGAWAILHTAGLGRGRSISSELLTPPSDGAGAVPTPKSAKPSRQLSKSPSSPSPVQPSTEVGEAQSWDPAQAFAQFAGWNDLPEIVLPRPPIAVEAPAVESTPAPDEVPPPPEAPSEAEAEDPAQQSLPLPQRIRHLPAP